MIIAAVFVFEKIKFKPPPKIKDVGSKIQIPGLLIRVVGPLVIAKYTGIVEIKGHAKPLIKIVPSKKSHCRTRVADIEIRIEIPEIPPHTYKTSGLITNLSPALRKKGIAQDYQNKKTHSSCLRSAKIQRFSALNIL
jgi:hypothetical protein